MRDSKVGLIFLLLMPVVAMAQLSGSVESIGFENHFRPDSWTRMIITVTPDTPATETYEVQVRLQDLDRDLPIATRQITVTGSAENTNRTQRYEMYFVPPPTNDGLPDASDPGALRILQERLKVSIHKATGGKDWICDLPITATVQNIDPVERGFASKSRGSKLIIAVSGGSSRAIYEDPKFILGVTEDVLMVNVLARDLPENVLGYDGVDGVVWMDADPADLKTAGDEKYQALDAYIRRGGRLVISQAFDWQKILQFQDLLPVTVTGIEVKDNVDELRELVAPRDSRDPGDLIDPKPPYRFARATAKPQTLVESSIVWKPATADAPAETSPYLARMPWGLGSVTWIAQDLGDKSIPRPTFGWMHAWDKVFDWNNSPFIVTTNTTEATKFPYDTGRQMDVGRSLIEYWMDLQSKSAWLITLAVLFFVGYWLIAGPGSYTFLAARRKTELSWFIFGLCALGATGLTALMTKLVLRGPPELKHFSVVKIAPNQPAMVSSRIGLYIPRDGMQHIELKGFAPGTVNTITPLMIHPYFLKDVPDQTGKEYFIPVQDKSSTAPPAIDVPYRSTLKKLQVTWTGTLTGNIQGSVKLVPPIQNHIAGRLTNATGKTLKNVYIAFNYPSVNTTSLDWIYYWRTWDPGATIDLARDFAARSDGSRYIGFQPPNEPAVAPKAKGRIDIDWMPFWTEGLSNNMMEDTYDDSRQPIRRSLAIMSFYDRLAPMKNSRLAGARPTRVEILRRGGRWLDMSAAIAAGELVIVAEAENVPLPVPLEVDGDLATGDGLILYQFVLPLDHSMDLTQSDAPKVESEPAPQATP